MGEPPRGGRRQQSDEARLSASSRTQYPSAPVGKQSTRDDDARAVGWARDQVVADRLQRQVAERAVPVPALEPR